MTQLFDEEEISYWRTTNTMPITTWTISILKMNWFIKVLEYLESEPIAFSMKNFDGQIICEHESCDFVNSLFHYSWVWSKIWCLIDKLLTDQVDDLLYWNSLFFSVAMVVRLSGVKFHRRTHSITLLQKPICTPTDYSKTYGTFMTLAMIDESGLLVNRQLCSRTITINRVLWHATKDGLRLHRSCKWTSLLGQ